MSSSNIFLKAEFPEIIIPRDVVKNITNNLWDCRQSTDEQMARANMALIERNHSLCYDEFYAGVVAGLEYETEYYQDMKNELVERVNMFLNAQYLDEDLATRVVEYYVTDIWAVLKTSKNYINTDRVVLHDFENTSSIFNKATVNNNNEPRVTLRRSTADTCRKYFRFVFPVPTLRIVDVAETYVDGVAFGTIRHVLLRHAYVYFMANMFTVGREAEARAFHDILERRFFATLRIMP
ncbi:hypothetical protein INT47_006740 [Mucor saturninus]|uniref:Uncharacterized protein n=1 Tax=Mucor saturninus TaxID=64648 RepID=A0A8H7QM49_9FUNG|nr:hypothetical protein INT47_006740 [Mucor saturninus]